jgi:hypothetical protein
MQYSIISSALLILFSSAFCWVSLAQPNESRVNKTIQLNEVNALEARMTSFKKSVFIADSMYSIYLDSTFHLQTTDPKLFESGLTWIRRLYVKTQSFKPNNNYCEEILSRIDNQIERENNKDADLQYRKLIEVADKKYAAGETDKAIELYKRASVLKPNDDYPKKMLDVIRLKEEEPKKEK